MTVTLVGDFTVYDGYGSMNEYMARGMHRAGARLGILPLFLDTNGCSEEFLRLLACSPARMDGPVLYTSWLLRPEFACLTGTELYARTMYEGAAILPEWVTQLNRTRGIIAPTTFVADVFRSCGVTVPISVVPDGVDPEVYFYEPPPERAGITTLIVGMLLPRKLFLEGVEAWRRAFKDDPEARLLLKGRSNWNGRFTSDDPRITVITASETTRGIAHWYGQADVLLALGNEGFGLPLIEGMASGLPVIALNSEGQADVCRDAGDLVLAVSPESWQPHIHHDGNTTLGYVGVPGIDDVAAKLRWVAEHRDEAADIGRAASTWVHQHRNVWRYGPDVLAAMGQRPERPPNPTYSNVNEPFTKFLARKSGSLYR